MTRLGFEPMSLAAEHWKNERIKKLQDWESNPRPQRSAHWIPRVGQTELRTIQAECGVCILLDLDVWRSMPSHFYRELPRNTRYQYFLSCVT